MSEVPLRDIFQVLSMLMRRVNEEGESHEGVDIRKASQPLLGLTSKIKYGVQVHWDV